MTGFPPSAGTAQISGGAAEEELVICPLLRKLCDLGVLWCLSVGVECLARLMTSVGGAARKDGEDNRG